MPQVNWDIAGLIGRYLRTREDEGIGSGDAGEMLQDIMFWVERHPRDWKATKRYGITPMQGQLIEIALKGARAK